MFISLKWSVTHEKNILCQYGKNQRSIFLTIQYFIDTMVYFVPAKFHFVWAGAIFLICLNFWLECTTKLIGVCGLCRQTGTVCGHYQYADTSIIGEFKNIWTEQKEGDIKYIETWQSHVTSSLLHVCLQFCVLFTSRRIQNGWKENKMLIIVRVVLLFDLTFLCPRHIVIALSVLPIIGKNTDYW